MTRRRRVFVLALGLYAAGMGFLGGMLLDRMLYDRQRASVLARVSQAEQRLHARLMEIERRP